MSTSGRDARPNSLLASLPRRETERLLAACDAVELEFGTVLYEPDSQFAHVNFPTDSFISLMIPVDGTSSLEVGLVGNEGMLGTSTQARGDARVHTLLAPT